MLAAGGGAGGGFPNYGFTTNTVLDNTICSTVSTLNNPYRNTAHANGQPLIEGVQVYNLMNTSQTRLAADDTGTPNIYANSMYRAITTTPVAIQEVGGVVARNLPTLSQNGYFLVTSDILDNYKDNVKAGDVIPLLGVVAKSSLSNQDFIVAENQIVQQLSSSKVVNKVKITVLNPDLTAPELDPFSSVILKITVPNVTPAPLLPLKVQQQIQEENETN